LFKDLLSFLIGNKNFSFNFLGNRRLIIFEQGLLRDCWLDHNGLFKWDKGLLFIVVILKQSHRWSLLGRLRLDRSLRLLDRWLSN